MSKSLQESAFRTYTRKALSARIENMTNTPCEGPMVEVFTDSHGRQAIRYLRDDVECGIAAGSEVLVDACPNCGMWIDPWGDHRREGCAS